MEKRGPNGYQLNSSEIQAEPTIHVAVPKGEVGDLPVNPASPRATGSFYNAQYTLSSRNDGFFSTAVDVARGFLNSEARLSRKAEFIKTTIAAGTLLGIIGALISSAKDDMDRPSPYQTQQPTVTPARPSATRTPVILNKDNQPVALIVKGKAVNA